MSTTPTTINLTQRQTMLSLAYLSYTGEGLTTTNPAATIKTDMVSAMSKLPTLTGWNIVWGPVVYTVPGSLYQDNLMYIAQNDNDKTQYAIGIRGTNFLSYVDWLLEDFEILRLMPWPLGASNPSPAGAGVSESTSLDMTVLVDMIDTVTTKDSFIGFLQSISQSKIDICVTGHSKGGVLASTMGLYLLENQTSGTKWDTSGVSTVSCISFAGPTAGNAAFAAYSDSTFVSAFNSNPPPAKFPSGQTGWDPNLGTNCDVVQCSYDLAPQMWIADQFYKNNVAGPLFSSYGGNINFSADITITTEMATFAALVLSGVSGMLASQGYTQINNAGGALPGTFNGPASTNVSFADYLSAFQAQATWQHSNSYPAILNVSGVTDPDTIIRNIVSISSSSVLSGNAGDTLQGVVIDVDNLSFITNPVVNVSGGGVTVSNMSISDSQITVDLTISSKASAGQVCGLTVSGQSGLNSLSSAPLIFFINMAIKVDGSSNPLSGSPGNTVSGIVIDIPNLAYISNPVLMISGPGTGVTAINTQFNTHIFDVSTATTDIQIDANAAPGNYVIALGSNGLVMSNGLGFTVS